VYVADVDATLAGLRAAGVPVVGEPEDQPRGPNALPACATPTGGSSTWGLRCEATVRSGPAGGAA
jgi:hypothetical protein